MQLASWRLNLHFLCLWFDFIIDQIVQAMHSWCTIWLLKLITEGSQDSKVNSQDKVSQPHFEGSVRSPLTLLKMGLGSPPGLPKIQNTIAGVKTLCIEVFFIPLERSWILDVWNGLPWAIWTSVAQVTVKRKAGSQIGNLTPDHKKSRIDPIPVCAGGVRHTIGKLSRRATSSLQTLLQSEVGTRSFERPKSLESKPGQFRDSTLGVPGQRAIWVWARWSNAENTIWGKVVASPESGPWWVKWVQGRPWLVPTPKGCRMNYNQLVVGFGCRTE
jgi:hypothetical protein